MKQNECNQRPVIAQIREIELMNNRISKYIDAFGYFNKSLIVLSATSGGVSIASLASNIDAPAGKASASFGFAFSLSTGIINKFVKTTKKKKKKHDKIVMLARNKPNSIESTISKSLT